MCPLSRITLLPLFSALISRAIACRALLNVLPRSQAVHIPAIKNTRWMLLAIVPFGASDVRRCEFVAKLLSESQLVVIVFQLRRLHETANLRPPVEVCLLLGSILFLLLHLVQLGIVPSVLLHRNQEVTQVKTELVVLCVERE